MVNKIEIQGADYVIKNLNHISTGVSGAGLVPPMRKATLIVTSEAKRLAPVDTGTLRARIQGEVKTVHGNKIEGIVGSPTKYAAAMEFGTRPHTVPLDALRVWARRHGISAWGVQRSIARKGTKPRLFLTHAYENNTAKISQIFDDYVKDLTS